jgi:hypothetical protein
MVVLVVVLMLAGAAGATVYATHRTRADVEPTVREFAEFRAAISHQVDGLHRDTETTARHARDGSAAGSAQPGNAGAPSVRR